VADGRDERKKLLEAVTEIVQRERDAYPRTQALTDEVQDVLERCLFDREAALAVLRGEVELDDDPWSRCPSCDCDTYFRMRSDIVETRGGPGWYPLGPFAVFVCEGCQHTEMRALATIEEGQWWTDAIRVRARPPEVGHPFRGDVEPVDDGSSAPKADDSQPIVWSDRNVCPDGACIGIIGEGGKCNVCGRAAEPQLSS
jgi:hypothetical protein